MSQTKGKMKRSTGLTALSVSSVSSQLDTLVQGGSSVSLDRIIKDITENQKEIEAMKALWSEAKDDLEKQQASYIQDTKNDLDIFKNEVKNEVKNGIKIEIAETKVKVIETLGVFVALFTFVSLDFTLLKGDVNPLVSVALILVAGGLLLAFILTMHYILTSEKATRGKPFAIWLLSLILLAAGIGILYSAKTKTPFPTSDKSDIDIHVNNNLKNSN